ncbi:MAG: serine hydrolase domain-containing protein [Anaerolineales bacterium]|jgi:CubicO group peptidase (beta-lactamase class C family)
MKWPIRILWIVVACAGLLAACAPQQGDFTGVNTLDTDQMARVDAIVEGYRATYNYINVALVLDNEIVLTKSYGQNQLNRTDVYASVSKPVTAMIFMQLLESGQIEDVRDEVVRYCPEYAKAMPDRYADSPITFHHLLTHQSGVSHLSDVWDGEKLNLAFRPGTDVMYSSNGYGILGLVMTQITGMSYPELLETYIARPVGAESFEAPDIFATPSGQVRSTIADMALFSIGVMDGTYISDGLLQEVMLQRYASGESGDICLGWFCDSIGNPDMTIYHNGSNGRPRAHLRIEFGGGMAVAITGMDYSESGVQNFGDLAIELMEFLKSCHR